jgi:hypothetical protein
MFLSVLNDADLRNIKRTGRRQSRDSTSSQTLAMRAVAVLAPSLHVLQNVSPNLDHDDDGAAVPGA